MQQLETQALLQLEALTVRPTVAALPTPAAGSSSSSAGLTAQSNPIQDAISTAELYISGLVTVGVVWGWLIFGWVFTFFAHLLFPASPSAAVQAKTTPVQPAAARVDAAKTDIGAAAPSPHPVTLRPLFSPTTGNATPAHHLVPLAASTNHVRSTAKAH
jgi:hypothetical protein